MTDGPLISIVTPSLNQGVYLPSALESVALASDTMSAGAVEHLVMDAGSTDGSREIIEQWASTGRLAYWRSFPDRGQSAAINEGLARARGVYAAWLNADDWYEPGALAHAAAALRADPSIDVLVCRCLFVDAQQRVVFRPVPPEPVCAAELLKITSRWFAGRSIAQPEVLFRRELFDRVGGLDEHNHYTMDYDLWLKFARAGAKFVSLDLHLANLRVHAAQKTAQRLATRRSVFDVAQRHAAALGDALGDAASAVRSELARVRWKLYAAEALAPACAAATRPAERGPGWSSTPAIDAIAAEHARRLVSTAEVGGTARPRLAAIISPSPSALTAALEHVPGLEIRSTSAAQLTPREHDLVVLDRQLLIEADARETVAAALCAARSWLLVLAEPAPWADLSAYAAWIMDRATGAVAADHDTLLWPEADALLAALPPSKLVRHAVDIDAELESLSGTVGRTWERIAWCSTGAPAHLPCAPIGAPPAETGAAFTACPGLQSVLYRVS